MKKTGLFKIIMFVLLGIVLVTWIVPASYFNAGELSELGMYRIGFFDFFQLLMGSYEFSYFLQILILLVSVGALYGVLGKTGKYRALIDKIASKFKGKEFIFVVVIAFVIAALTSVFDYGLTLFIFIPAIISIILAMGYDKITAFLSTFGAMLVGTIGSTLGYNTVGAINEQLSITSLSTGIYYKIGLFVFALAALLFFLSKAKCTVAKKASNKVDSLVEDAKSDDLFIGEKISNKYSVVPIIVIFSILFVLVVLGCTNWIDTFGVNAFTSLNTAITGFTIKDFTIFAYLLGTISELGKWYYAEMAVMCLIASLLIGVFYRIKLSDIFSSMADGFKKMIAPAALVVLAYAVVYFAGNTMFFGTIANFILGATEKFNIFFSSIVTILGSALHVDMLYVATYVVPQLGAQNISSTVVALLVQGLYGVTMFVTPTSALLILGLSYLGISYKEWIKKTWKLVVALLVIVLIAVIISMI